MLKIYNDLTRQKEEFKPIQPGKVSMHVCGMTCTTCATWAMRG